MEDVKMTKVERLKAYEAKFKGQDKRAIAELYNAWGSKTYDEDMEAVDHRGRVVISDTLERWFTGDKTSAKVLDVAAGTGMLAETLRERGFTQLDALDGSRVMLEIAQEKKLYQKYFCHFMEEINGVIDNDTYDIVCSLGAIGPGHLESTALLQMYKITKPGGLLCISGVKERWDNDQEYHKRMRGIIDELEKTNRVKVLEDRTIVEYYFYKNWRNGVLIVLKKL